MRSLTVTGTNLEEMQNQLSAWYKPGAKLYLDIESPRDLSAEELGMVQEELQKQGMLLTAPVQIGTGDWPNTLKIQFQNPSGYGMQVGVLPLVVMIIAALGIVGIGAMVGWRLGDIIKENVAPILITTAIVILGFALISTKSQRGVEVTGEYKGAKGRYRI